MISAPRPAAFGFSVHTGWAQAVVVTGPLASPQLIHRARVDLSPGKESVEVFHIAAEKTPAEAKRHVERCRKMAVDKAHAELMSLMGTVKDQTSPVAVGVVVSNATLPTSLDAILRSHMQIHSAEGDFFRRAILQATETLELKPFAVSSKELAFAASGVLKVPPEKIPLWLNEFGRTVGRPWGRDEKDAFLVACVALAGRRQRSNAN